MAEWKKMLFRFQQPSKLRASWQIIDSFVPYAALWVLMYFTMGISWWLTVPLAMLGGALLMRIFIIFHDCGHGSFFKSRLANDITGFIAGIFTFTPYYHWRWEHSIHHGSSGNLDRRGTGDVWTLTVQEYLESSRLKRFAYRLARNPFILFVIAPVFLFVVKERFPASKASARERHSVWAMNAAVLALAVILSLIFGLKAYLLIQLIVIATAGTLGVWMFYVQHQFEDTYWEHNGEWDYASAAIQGSSFYKLPRILQWFSGNIGFHHIHHLSPHIANYNLERCHNALPILQAVKPLTFFVSLKSINFRLWDEQRGRLIGFRELRRLRREQANAEKK